MSYNSLLGELSVSYATPLGEDTWKLAPGFLQTLFHLHFPFADFALYFFALINHYEYDYVLSPLNTPRES